MNFIRITNKGAVHRFLLEIIGLGTKQGRQDDVLIVGQYHSGFKLATPAAIRLGMKVVAASNDAIGSYVLNFATKKIAFAQNGEIMDAELLCYKYSDGREVDLSIALTAFPQWEMAIGDDGNRTYPILREYIANARDEDKNYTLEFGIANVVQSPADHTAVYVEETEEADAILKKHPARYFKFMGAVPLFAVPDAGAIYTKSSKETRFFNQGYLVGCKKDEWVSESLYDYDIYGKDIVNEIRAIRERCVFDERVAELFTLIRNKSLLRKIIEFAQKNSSSYEAGIFGRRMKRNGLPEEFKALCREIWNDKFKETSVVSCGKNEIDSEAKAILKIDVVALPYDLREFFKSVGIKDAEQKLKEYFSNLGERPLNEDEQALIGKIRKKYFDEMEFYKKLTEKYPVAVLIDKFKCLNGIASSGKVFIGESRLGEEEMHVLKTYLHELRHCRTGFHDTDRNFVDAADYEIVYMLQYAAFYRYKIRILEHKLFELGVNPEDLFSPR